MLVISSSSRSSPRGARAGCFVRCDSSHLMSLCVGLPARAGGLVSLLCIFCVFFRLLLICDVELALSLLLAGVVKSCCLPVRRACRPCPVVQSFPGGWTMGWAASSPMSGLVDGGGEVLLPAGASCVQAWSYRAEFSRRLDNKVGGLIAHVGPCRWGRR